MGELVLEALLNSNIDTITDLNIEGNLSWFRHPGTKEERYCNVNLLLELFSKQAGLQHINLCDNRFSSNATMEILKRIAEHHSTSSKLQTLNIAYTNLNDDETVEHLADILFSAFHL